MGPQPIPLWQRAMEKNMSDENNMDLEIEALSDEDLEAVAGGADGCDSKSCSKRDCSGGGDDSTTIDGTVKLK